MAASWEILISHQRPRTDGYKSSEDPSYVRGLVSPSSQLKFAPVERIESERRFNKAVAALIAAELSQEHFSDMDLVTEAIDALDLVQLRRKES